MLSHVRNRYAMKLLLKKLQFSPVVLIQGPRQTGKSFLIRSLLPKTKCTVHYRTFDLAATRQIAEDAPDTFVRDSIQNTTTAIDEAQRVPAVFESVKAVVDEERRPGQFILLGSTEFSKLSLIRESLTGRASRLRLFPLTLSESLHQEMNTQKVYVHQKPRVSRSDLLRFFDNGGMPGIFNIRNGDEKKQALQDWLMLIAERDALNFTGVKIEPSLILRILNSLSSLEDTSAGALARHLRVDLRKIKSHLNVLKTLFVVNEVAPHPDSTGKHQYYFCDVAFLNYYNTTMEKKIVTWVVQELLALMHYREENSTRHLYFYRTSKGEKIDIVIEENEKIILALKIYPFERVQKRNLRLLKSLEQNFKDRLAPNYKLVALTGSLEKLLLDGIHIYPWEGLA